MLTVDPPELVSVTVWVCCVPTDTLPKAALLGLRASAPGSDPFPLPVPARLRFTAAFDALLVIVAVPLKDATALGANETLIEVLAPASRVSGRLIGAREKYWLEIAMLLIVTLAVPEFVTVADRVLLLPDATLPKSNVDVDSETVPDCCWSACPPTLRP